MKRFKIFIFILAFGAFFMMVIFYMLNMLDWANNFGSFGFAALLVAVVLYLPDFLKKGYIEKF